ncbi:GPI transamidase component PIG-S, partial [Linum grandiflorum]
ISHCSLRVATMSEISELRPITEPTPTTLGACAEEASPTPSELDFDPKIMRTTKPGLKRLFLTFSVLLSFLLGLLYSSSAFPSYGEPVEIYRSPLPFHDMDTLSKEIESSPVQFPCHFRAVFLNFASRSSSNSLDPFHLRSTILAGMTKLTSQTQPRQCGSCSENFTLSVTVDSGDSTCRRSDEHGSVCSYKCGRIGALKFDHDEGVDEALRSVLDESCSDFSVKVYTVVVMNGSGEEPRGLVGKYRHGWIVGKELEAEAVMGRVAEMFVGVFRNGGRDEGVIQGEFMPVGADGRVVLSFNLLNANPDDWVYDWDFQRIDETLLSPMIEALKPIASISVESQVLYHTPKSSFSYWDESSQSYIFSTRDLPFFVNSNEWHLDTSVAAGGRSKILQFVAHQPFAEEFPLFLQLPSGDISRTNGFISPAHQPFAEEFPLFLQLPSGDISRTNGFISPMWGGIMVWNPQSSLKNSSNEPPARQLMSPDDLQEIFDVLLGQLRQVFGLKSDGIYVGAAGSFELLASEKGFTEWQENFLLSDLSHLCTYPFDILFS